MNYDLKPCPHCKSMNTYIGSFNNYKFNMIEFYIVCKDCNYSIEGRTKDEVLEYWFVRPFEDELSLEIKSLQQQLENVKGKIKKVVSTLEEIGNHEDVPVVEREVIRACRKFLKEKQNENRD